MEKCIQSWKKYCPDWEIIEWNEDNFDVNFCPYAAKAYKEKRYGFLSDCARLKIIYENGGVYLDTDVELKNSLDDLLQHGAWFGYGTATEINTGCGFGAIKGHNFLLKLLQPYIEKNENAKFALCTALDTEVFHKELEGFAADKHIEQQFGDIKIINNIWRYVIHHYTGTWRTPTQKLYTNLMKIKIVKKFVGIIRKK